MRNCYTKRHQRQEIPEPTHAMCLEEHAAERLSWFAEEGGRRELVLKARQAARAAGDRLRAAQTNSDYRGERSGSRLDDRRSYSPRGRDRPVDRGRSP